MPFPAATQYIRRHHGPRRVLLVVPVLVLVASLFVFVQPRPTLAPLGADNLLAVTQPVVFNFIVPVARTLRVTATPHIDGELRYSQPLFGNSLYRRATFTPTTTWEPGTTYRVSLADVQSAIPGLRSSTEQSFSFTTAAVPKVVSITPSADTPISADTSWRVTLDRPADETVAFSFATEPALPLLVAPTEDKLHFVVTPAQLLPQGVPVQLHVQRSAQQLVFGTSEVAEQGEAQEVFSQAWNVRTAAGVAAFSPQGTNQLLTTPIAVTLTETADLEVFTKAIALTPPVVGEWTTSDGLTFSLAHEPLLQRTAYTFKLASALRTKAGGFLPADATSAFSTIGPVVLATSAPANATSGIRVGSTLHFTFDQPVDQADAAKRVRISPTIQGVITWQRNTLNFNPNKDLAFDTTYTATFTKGVVGNAGFPSADDIVVRFTTERATTRLAVPFHRQDHALSCEIATLVMALRYRGINVGEAPIIKAIGVDPTPKKNGVWGDPDVAFVGNIDGQQPGTGYGVYAAPIAKAGSAYRKTRAFKNGNLTDLLTEIKAGNPVIVWGNGASGRRVDWKTLTGKTVLAIVGEHTRVVIGFVGSASNPSSIITLDPLYGEKRFSKAAFLADWALLGNMGVVVE